MEMSSLKKVCKKQLSKPLNSLYDKTEYDEGVFDCSVSFIEKNSLSAKQKAQNTNPPSSRFFLNKNTEDLEETNQLLEYIVKQLKESFCGRLDVWKEKMKNQFKTSWKEGFLSGSEKRLEKCLLNNKGLNYSQRSIIPKSVKSKKRKFRYFLKKLKEDLKQKVENCLFSIEKSNTLEISRFNDNTIKNSSIYNSQGTISIFSKLSFSSFVVLKRSSKKAERCLTDHFIFSNKEKDEEDSYSEYYKGINVFYEDLEENPLKRKLRRSYAKFFCNSDEESSLKCSKHRVPWHKEGC